MNKSEQVKSKISEGAKPEIQDISPEQVKDAVRRANVLIEEKGKDGRVGANREGGTIYRVRRQEDGGVRFEKSYRSAHGWAEIGKPFIYSATLYPDGRVVDHVGEERPADLGSGKDRVSSQQMSVYDLPSHLEAIEAGDEKINPRDPRYPQKLGAEKEK